MGLGSGDHPPVNEDSNGNPPFPIGNTSRNGGISSLLCTGVFRFLLGGAKRVEDGQLILWGILLQKWPLRGWIEMCELRIQKKMMETEDLYWILWGRSVLPWIHTRSKKSLSSQIHLDFHTPNSSFWSARTATSLATEIRPKAQGFWAHDREAFWGPKNCWKRGWKLDMSCPGSPPFCVIECFTTIFLVVEVYHPNGTSIFKIEDFTEPGLLEKNIDNSPMHGSGQMITTSHQLFTAKGGWGREIPVVSEKLGWWNTTIWPDG